MTDSPYRTMPAVFQPIESYLPHRPPMLLLSSVLRCDEDNVWVLAKVDATAWYADAQGRMPAWIGIELMAQAVAAHIGVLASQGHRAARPGALLGSQHYVMHQSAFVSAAHLEIQATSILSGESGHGAYACRIVAGAVCAAEAIIKVYQPDDFSAFLEGRVSS